MGRETPALTHALKRLSHCLVLCGTGKHLMLARIRSGLVFDQKLRVFITPEWPHFANLQSRVHEVWARAFSGTFKDDLSYNHTDCLETFPLLPSSGLANLALAAAGQTFHDARAGFMQAENIGLTATHNRLDDAAVQTPAIQRLRTLHDAMDQAVLRAYAWPHPMPTCVHEPEWPGSDDERPGPQRRRWPEAERARVLEFLWRLNEDEAATGGNAARARLGRKPRSSTPTPAPLLEPT